MLNIHEKKIKNLTPFEKAIYTKFGEVLAAVLLKTIKLEEAKFKLDALLKIEEEKIEIRDQKIGAS